MRIAGWIAAALVSSAAAGAQLPHPIPAGDSALASCGRAASVGNKRAAEAAADSAERVYKAATANQPTATVRLARVIAACRLPVASFFSKPRLGTRAEAILKGVLAKDSTEWEARYTLALLYYHAPAFLGKSADAIREFQALLAQQDNRVDFSEEAGPYAYLGDLYQRAGRNADAVDVWRRGLALFPDDSLLKRRNPHK